MKSPSKSVYKGLTIAQGVPTNFDRRHHLFGTTALEIRRPDGAVLDTAYYQGGHAERRQITRAEGIIDSWESQYPKLFTPKS